MLFAFIHDLFSARGFMPHGHCYQCEPIPFWISVWSDFLISLSYFAIAVLIFFVTRQRKDIRFRGLSYLFGGFILFCGLTHFMAMIVMWEPFYRLDSLLKLITGIVSATTAVVLIVKLKDILKIPTPAQYQQAQEDLHHETLEKIHAEEANREKSAFLSNMSHELRTPLTSILCALDILSSEDQSEEAEEVTTIAHNSSRHLLSLINDILDLSKIEAGEIVLNKEAFSISYSMAGVCEMLRLQAQSKKIELKWTVEEPCPVVLIGDPVRLNQVATNLIGNAVKFTRDGYVDVRVSFEEYQDKKVWIKIDITDTGPGIEKENLDKIFAAFKQANDTDHDQSPGTGLGLTISRQLVKLMGGEITVRSEVGVGSCFTIRLPFDHADEEKQALFLGKSEREAGVMLKDHATKSLDILLVEDNTASQRIIQKILEIRGHRVTAVTGASDAIKAFSAQRFNIVIMDVRLGEESGVECARSLRQAEKDSHTPILGLSAQSLASDLERALSAGMDDYLVKPVQAKRLVQRVEDLGS